MLNKIHVESDVKMSLPIAYYKAGTCKIMLYLWRVQNSHSAEIIIIIIIIIKI